VLETVVIIIRLVSYKGWHPKQAIDRVACITASLLYCVRFLLSLKAPRL
jgi:hypothetical protein